jgi:hypothetical protein
MLLDNRRFSAFWNPKSTHQDQLKAQMWELQNQYPKLWAQLKRGDITTEQAVFGMVHSYERPAISRL